MKKQSKTIAGVTVKSVTCRECGQKFPNTSREQIELAWSQCNRKGCDLANVSDDMLKVDPDEYAARYPQSKLVAFVVNQKKGHVDFYFEEPLTVKLKGDIIAEPESIFETRAVS